MPNNNLSLSLTNFSNYGLSDPIFCRSLPHPKQELQPQHIVFCFSTSTQCNKSYQKPEDPIVIKWEKAAAKINFKYCWEKLQIWEMESFWQWWWILWDCTSATPTFCVGGSSRFLQGHQCQGHTSSRATSSWWLPLSRPCLLCSFCRKRGFIASSFISTHSEFYWNWKMRHKLIGFVGIWEINYNHARNTRFISLIYSRKIMSVYMSISYLFKE